MNKTCIEEFKQFCIEKVEYCAEGLSIINTSTLSKKDKKSWLTSLTKNINIYSECLKELEDMQL